MLTRIQKHFLKNVSRWGTREQIYIIPTFDALKLLALNLTLLVIGLVYANNFVLFFNFVLFCLFLSSMYYTHFNLRGLKLLYAKSTAVHAKENGKLTLTFLSQSDLGHFFISARLPDQSIVKIHDNQRFSITRTDQKQLIELSFEATTRGHQKIDYFVIETLFPFHLFRCLFVARVSCDVCIYPERKNLNLHQETPLEELEKDQGEEFNLRTYVLGDSLKRVHWKKLAQTNKWYTKVMLSPKEEPVVLSLNHQNPSREDQLSSLAHALYVHHQNQRDYGLTIPGVKIDPGHSPHHLSSCLRALADYES